MGQIITKESLKKNIFEAFKDVPKGDGFGVRECEALDDRASAEKLAESRALDTEQRWWEYPDNLKQFAFSYTLTYNNKDGIKFHLPALMTSVIDGLDQGTSEISIYRKLCKDDLAKENYDSVATQWPPHQYHREYLKFVKGINIQNIIDYYGFSPQQVHAIALYLLWTMHSEWQYHFFDTREAMLAWVKQDHERIPEEIIKKGNYNLTLEDAIAIMDEQHRIVRDWLKMGNVNFEEVGFEIDKAQK